MATTLNDGAGFTWDIQDNGSVYNGSNDAFDGAGVLAGYGSSTSTLEDGGREIVLAAQIIGNFSIVRKIYISPTSGFARYLEIVTNVGSSTDTFALTLRNALGSDSSTSAVTSSGDATLTAADRWITTDDSGGSDPFVTQILSGAGGTGPNSATRSGDQVDYTYNLALAAGQTKVVMHFLSQNGSAADALADATQLSGLGGDALAGMSALELSQLYNFSAVPIVNLSLKGTSGIDNLLGGAGNDNIDGLAGNDFLSGLDGNDKILGGIGNDVLLGGDGKDQLLGGAGNDYVMGEAGDDQIFGDARTAEVTSSAVKTISAGETLAISLTLPDASNSTSLVASGFVSRTPITSERFNVSFVIDVSSSTLATFNGSTTVGDLNGDGTANTVLDAEIAGFEKLLSSLSKQVGSDATVSIVAFSDNAEIMFTGIANADNDGNGRSDVIDALRKLGAGGGTDFEAGLQEATDFFEGQSAGQNLLYFLSDGENNQGSGFDDEVAHLRSKTGLNVTIKSFGVGADASEAQLDMLDDNVNNNSATIILDPSVLGRELIDPHIEKTDIARVELLVNGKIVKTIPGSALIETALGLHYDFNQVVSGLSVTANDTIVARVIAAGANGKVVTTSQVVEAIAGVSGADVLSGGDGRDQMYGGGNNDTLSGGNDDDRLFGDDGNDVLLGERGADILKGQAGSDLLDGGRGADQMAGGTGDDRYYVESIGDKVAENAGGGRDTVFSSITLTLGLNVENLTLTGDRAINGTGNAASNVMRGNDAKNALAGGDAADTLVGGGGNDSLTGGKGADVLTGGAGADKFIFKLLTDSTVAASGRDTITDFLQSQLDRIVLTAIDADVSHTGNDGFTFIGTAAFHHVAGELRYQKGSTSTTVTGDIDGDGDADFSIALSKVLTLTKYDFDL